MEKILLSAALQSRTSFATLSEYLNLKTYSRQFQILFAYIEHYYKRDTEAKLVDKATLVQLVATGLKNDKHLSDFTYLIDEALATEVSEPNIKQMVLLAKREEVGDQLATALANKAEDQIPDLLERYQKLHKATELETGRDALTIYRNVDLGALMASEYDPASFLKLYPLSLNERLDGGVKRGHHVVSFGRPESGKSMFNINAACGFARQGYHGLYIINEDRPEDIILRCVSNLSGMTKQQIKEDNRRAMDAAVQYGFDYISVVSCAPGTPSMIEDLISKQDKVDWIVVDQLRNLKVKADNRVNQLEYAATSVRNIAKAANVVALSVTQAGDSADGKAVLEQGDVDYSNTGIPAQADLMVGIGVNLELEQQGFRIISLPKNKLSGDHGAFPVKVDPQLSRMKSTA